MAEALRATPSLIGQRIRKLDAPDKASGKVARPCTVD